MTLKEFIMKLSYFEGTIKIIHRDQEDKWHDVRVFKNGEDEMWNEYCKHKNDILYKNEVKWFTIYGDYMKVCI